MTPPKLDAATESKYYTMGFNDAKYSRPSLADDMTGEKADAYRNGYRDGRDHYGS